MIPSFERQADECTLCSGTVLLAQTQNNESSRRDKSNDEREDEP
jgi:hypothetical protein